LRRFIDGLSSRRRAEAEKHAPVATAEMPKAASPMTEAAGATVDQQRPQQPQNVYQRPQQQQPTQQNPRQQQQRTQPNNGVCVGVIGCVSILSTIALFFADARIEQRVVAASQSAQSSNKHSPSSDKFHSPAETPPPRLATNGVDDFAPELHADRSFYDGTAPQRPKNLALQQQHQRKSKTDSEEWDIPSPYY
jgi:hypothetical protein